MLRNEDRADGSPHRIDDTVVVTNAAVSSCCSRSVAREDLAGVDGKRVSLHQEGWQLRDYQRLAADSLGGSGVVVLPWGRQNAGRCSLQ